MLSRCCLVASRCCLAAVSLLSRCSHVAFALLSCLVLLSSCSLAALVFLSLLSFITLLTLSHSSMPAIKRRIDLATTVLISGTPASRWNLDSMSTPCARSPTTVSTSPQLPPIFRPCRRVANYFNRRDPGGQRTNLGPELSQPLRQVQNPLGEPILTALGTRPRTPLSQPRGRCRDRCT